MTTRLIDPFGRSIEYLRLSVTDRCDLRCSYCMPKGFRDFTVPDAWLTFTEIERVVGAFVRRGVRRVRLTGGEPLVRRNLPDLARSLAALPGLEDLSISSNCTRMERLAGPLYEAGVRRLNVSLDSLRPETFKVMTAGRLDKVLGGIMAARSVGFQPIKVNMVVMRGINDNEVENILDFCGEHGFTLRLIETMPMGETGRAAQARYVDLQEIKRRLQRRFHLIPDVMPGGGPARYYRVKGSDISVGFITPISQHFCETCNRVRLSVDGTVYLCLGQEHIYPLRSLLRAGTSDAGLDEAVRRAVARKPERHEFREKPQQIVRFMSALGG